MSVMRFSIPRDIVYGENALDHLSQLKGKRAMLARRLGLDAVERVNRYDVETGESRWDMDAVTLPGASVQYTCSQNWRHTY